MSGLIVLENPKAWPLGVEGVEVVAARDYLTNSRFIDMRGVKIFNCCRSYRYQTVGYYVSLLAAARGHKPLPSIATILDLRLQPVIRVASQELDDLIQSSLHPLKSDDFQLSIYFGRNLAKRYDRLSRALFDQFPAPFLRASFEREDGQWSLSNVRAVPASEIPEEHREFVPEQAKRFFERPHRPRPRKPPRYEMAILVDPHEAHPPSDERALRRFERAAERHGFSVEQIGKDAYGRISEFDALFIRETTAVNHHTFRFARRATAEHVVVIDDPESILRCANKVFLAEMLDRHRLPTPQTVVIAKETAGLVPERIGFPCVVKQPDSSFSRGVIKIETADAYTAALPTLFEQSELLIAQEFVPTDFDWRVGVLDGEALFVCKYHMARRHWQIIKREGQTVREGAVEAFPVADAPEAVVSLGVRAANLIGNGLYGVDIKVLGGRPRVIEINDNPNIDGGFEDRVLGDRLYDRLVESFLRRLEARRK